MSAFLLGRELLAQLQAAHGVHGLGQRDKPPSWEVGIGQLDVTQRRQP